MTETRFGVNKTVAEVTEPVGRMERQSVAVLVDHSVTTPAEGGDPVATPRTAEEMQKIRALVESAIGFDAGRGDMLTVENLRFDDTVLPVEQIGGGFSLETLIPVARYLSVPLAVLLFALFVVRPAIGTLRSVSNDPAEEMITPTVARLQEVMRASGGAELPAGEVVPLRRRLVEAATEDPRAAALVVRNWLTVENKES